MIIYRRYSSSLVPVTEIFRKSLNILKHQFSVKWQLAIDVLTKNKDSKNQKALFGPTSFLSLIP